MPELILSGNEQQTVPVVISIAQGLGYEATQPSQGSIKLERGNLSKTLLLGAMAGKNFHISFTFDIGVDHYGNTWLRFDQDPARSAPSRAARSDTRRARTPSASSSTRCAPRRCSAACCSASGSRGSAVARLGAAAAGCSALVHQGGVSSPV